MSLGDQIAQAKLERNRLRAELKNHNNELSANHLIVSDLTDNQRVLASVDRLHWSLLPSDAAAQWKTDTESELVKVEREVERCANEAETARSRLSGVLGLITTLAATPPVGTECYILYLPAELLSMVFTWLPRHGHLVERVCKLFRAIINEPTSGLPRLKHRNRLYRDACEPRPLSSPRIIDKGATVVAGGDGNVWIHKNATAIGTNVLTGVRTKEFKVFSARGCSLRAVSPGGVMFFSAWVCEYISWKTPTGLQQDRFGVKGRLVGAVSDTHVVMKRIATIERINHCKFFVVDTTGVTPDVEILSVPRTTVESSTGVGLNVMWIENDRRTGVYITYSDVSTVIPTNYIWAGSMRLFVPIPETDCTVFHETGKELGVYDGSCNKVNNDISRLLPSGVESAVVAVGPTLVIATGKVFYVY